MNSKKEKPYGDGKWPYDRLGWSGHLSIFLLVIILICAFAPVMNNYFRTAEDSTGQVIRALNLNNLSITGSGRPFRRPDSSIVSVNLNFSPRFSCFEIYPEYLLLNPPQYSDRYVSP